MQIAQLVIFIYINLILYTCIQKFDVMGRKKLGN
jgi:hypothetical protein